MADNLTVTEGTGAEVATQDRSGVHFQQVLDTGAATIAAVHVTVTNTATELVAASANRKRVIIVNYQTVPIYVGADGLTTTTGLRLDPGASITLSTVAIVDAITAAAYTAAGEDDKVHVLTEYD